MAAPGGANQIFRRVIDDLIKFSRETSIDGYMSFFKSQQIFESHGFINRLHKKANIARNLVRQLNALIAKMEALEDQGELFDTLMDLRDDREAARTKLQGLNELITQAEQEIEMKEAQIQAMNGLRYGSILNILHGRNELFEKNIGCVVDSGGVLELDPKVSLFSLSVVILGGEIMETEANDLDYLVNYDNDNDIDDLGYESEVYLDDEEEDENNHSNVNVVKRGITRLSKFRKEYGKPDGIKLSVKSDAAKMARSKSDTMGRGGYAHVKEKMIKNKEIEPDEEPPRGILWLKGRVNKDGEFSDDEIRSMGDKLKETEDKIKEGTLKVDHGTDAMTVRYFDLPRSKQASDERIMLLQSQLDNERRERQEKELEIQNLSNKMSQRKGMVTKLMNQLVAQGEQLKSMSTQLTPPDVSPMDINPIDNSVDEEGVGYENDASIQKSNGLATLEKENGNKGK
ncbi:hypothetical protein Tco_0283098 [Tanacetum coccineum]